MSHNSMKWQNTVHFTPSMFSATGGMGHEATVFYKRLTSLLSENGMNHIQLFWDGLDAIYLSVSFVQQFKCIRGVRSSQGHFVKCAPVDLLSFVIDFKVYV